MAERDAIWAARAVSEREAMEEAIASYSGPAAEEVVARFGAATVLALLDSVPMVARRRARLLAACQAKAAP